MKKKPTKNLLGMPAAFAFLALDEKNLHSRPYVTATTKREVSASVSSTAIVFALAPGLKKPATLSDLVRPEKN
ncbi:MAG: hypothetical protein Kow0069_35020 [Promethearchaeota archaeon]